MLKKDLFFVLHFRNYESINASAKWFVIFDLDFFFFLSEMNTNFDPSKTNFEAKDLRNEITEPIRT